MSTERQRHILDVQRQYFMKIKDGSKIVEGRVGEVDETQNRRENYKAGETSYKTGDLIRFTISGATEEDSVTCQITDVRFYASFEEMLRGSELSACLPGVSALEEGVEIYRSFPGYRQREKLFGAVGIHIRRVLED